MYSVKRVPREWSLGPNRDFNFNSETRSASSPRLTSMLKENPRTDLSGYFQSGQGALLSRVCWYGCWYRCGRLRCSRGRMIWITKLSKTRWAWAIPRFHTRRGARTASKNTRVWIILPERLFTPGNSFLRWNAHRLPSSVQVRVCVSTNIGIWKQ